MTRECEPGHCDSGYDSQGPCQCHHDPYNVDGWGGWALAEMIRMQEEEKNRHADEQEVKQVDDYLTATVSSGDSQKENTTKSSGTSTSEESIIRTRTQRDSMEVWLL